MDLWIVAVFWALVITAPWMFMGYEALRQRAGRSNATEAYRVSGRKTAKRTTQRSRQKERRQK